MLQHIHDEISPPLPSRPDLAQLVLGSQVISSSSTTCSFLVACAVNSTVSVDIYRITVDKASHHHLQPHSSRRVMSISLLPRSDQVGATRSNTVYELNLTIKFFPNDEEIAILTPYRSRLSIYKIRGDNGICSDPVAVLDYRTGSTSASFAISPCGVFLALGSGDTVTLHKKRTTASEQTARSSTSTSEATAVVTTEWTHIASDPAHDQEITALHFSRNSRLLVSAGADLWFVYYDGLSLNRVETDEVLFTEIDPVTCFATTDRAVIAMCGGWSNVKDGASPTSPMRSAEYASLDLRCPVFGLRLLPQQSARQQRSHHVQDFQGILFDTTNANVTALHREIPVSGIPNDCVLVRLHGRPNADVANDDDSENAVQQIPPSPPWTFLGEQARQERSSSKLVSATSCGRVIVIWTVFASMGGPTGRFDLFMID